MIDDPAQVQSQSAEALAAYEALASRFEQEDPRDQYTYMYSKMRSDYALMEYVGVEDKDILNVGCSFPVDEIYYARKVRKWTSIDISQASLKAAAEIVTRELHPSLASKIGFQFADACALPFGDDTFDVAISMSTIDHIPKAAARKKAVQEMARTTKPGGHVIVTVPNWWCLPYAAGIWKMRREKTLHYGYVHLFSPLELRGIVIEAGLQPLHFASSMAPPDVWLPGYPALLRYPAGFAFRVIRAAGYVGRRIGFACLKPKRGSGHEAGS